MIINGRKIAEEKLEQLKLKVQVLKVKLKLAIVLIGNDPASKIYVNLKVKKARELGIETEIIDNLEKISSDATGIIIQLPGGENLIDKISLKKDVDGLRENSPFLPATVKAILVILNLIQDLYRFRVKPGMTHVIVGQGRLVGKPLSEYLEKNNFKVIRCDEFTKNLKNKTLQGDVLVAATGKERLITADMVKPGAIVIDCGSPKPEVDFENVKEVAGAITPVPGGVGPLTVISLLENLVEAAKMQTHA